MSKYGWKGSVVMSDCLFCKIINKEIPSQVVYENEAVLIFKDNNPAAPTHWLAVPKKHVDNVGDSRLIEGAILQSLFTAIQHVTKEKGLTGNGFRIVVNYGEDAGETIHHLHVHLLAGRKLDWPPG